GDDMHLLSFRGALAKVLSTLVQNAVKHAYREAGDGARALQALKAGLQRLPDEPALYRAEALLLSGQGQPDQALEVAQQLKARDKTGWQGLLLEGDLL
ncbi:tetratricopeptide repeat protein, partial [Acinetobacter baumannii]